MQRESLIPFSDFKKKKQTFLFLFLPFIVWFAAFNFLRMAVIWQRDVIAPRKYLMSKLVQKFGAQYFDSLFMSMLKHPNPPASLPMIQLQSLQTSISGVCGLVLTANSLLLELKTIKLEFVFWWPLFALISPWPVCLVFFCCLLRRFGKLPRNGSAMFLKATNKRFIPSIFPMMVAISFLDLVTKQCASGT